MGKGKARVERFHSIDDDDDDEENSDNEILSQTVYTVYYLCNLSQCSEFIL